MIISGFHGILLEHIRRIELDIIHCLPTKFKRSNIPVTLACLFSRDRIARKKIIKAKRKALMTAGALVIRQHIIVISYDNIEMLGGRSLRCFTISHDIAGLTAGAAARPVRICRDRGRAIY